jgi:aldose 1-epimerase
MALEGVNLMKTFSIFALNLNLILILNSTLNPTLTLTHPQGKATVRKDAFGKTTAGEAVEIYTLTNSNGLEARVMTYGAILVSMKVPDKAGKLDDVTLGFDSIDGYVQRHPFFGATVGRYANRIAKGRFTLNNKEYKLAVNNGENSLHGGIKGFDKAVWRARPLNNSTGVGVELNYLSKDGEEGYPGNLSVTVRYTLTNKDELKIDYLATTDADTVINLTNHSYFNLAGQGNGDILNHQMMINADRFTPTDAGSIPTGALRPVQGTPFDFRTPTKIGARINQNEEQLKLGKGYDHNFVLNDRNAAQVYEETSGRVLSVWTTEPGVQFYTANYLDGSLKGKGGKTYGPRAGFCLETQHFPDTPNKPNFPSAVLKKGAKHESTTIFRFSVK